MQTNLILFCDESINKNELHSAVQTLIRTFSLALQQVDSITLLPTYSSMNEIIKHLKQNTIIGVGKCESSCLLNVYNSIKNYLYKNIYIMSFNYKLIRKLKDTYSNLRCGVLSSTIINRDNIDDDFDFIAISSYSYHTIEDYVRPIFIWALNSKKKYLSLKKEMSNNTYFIVDNPVKFI